MIFKLLMVTALWFSFKACAVEVEILDNKENTFKNGKPYNGTFLEEFPWGMYFHVDIVNNFLSKKHVSYKDGKIEGLTIWYNLKYQILAKGYFKKGLPWNGKFVKRKNGCLWEIYSCKKGKKDGSVYYYWIKDYNQFPEKTDYKEFTVKQHKYIGTYKAGKKWNGVFIERVKNKARYWVYEHYKDGKLTKKQYTLIFSGISDEEAKFHGLLPFKTTPSYPKIKIKELKGKK